MLRIRKFYNKVNSKKKRGRQGEQSFTEKERDGLIVYTVNPREIHVYEEDNWLLTSSSKKMVEFFLLARKCIGELYDLL
jgi:hypothetical protein